LDEILNLTLTTASGEKVALRNIVASEAEPRSDSDRPQRPAAIRVTVRANVAGRDLGSVAYEVQALLDQIPRPVGYDLIGRRQFRRTAKSLP
jgi:hydrophobic/amphiphilic exporter-1 (mainly G- bacteria), HAE1 family